MFRRFRRTGDPAALAEVFDRTAPELLRLARLLVGRDAADDVVQATFVAAIDSAAAFDPKRRVRPWLCGLLANHAKRHRRALRREHEARERATPPAAALERSAAELAATAEGLARIRAATADCGEPYATVLRMHLEDGLNAKEIAARLGRPAGTVRTQLVRALDRLRQRLLGAARLGVVLSPTPALADLAGVRTAVIAHAKVATPGIAVSAAAVGTATGVGTGTLMMKKAVGAVAVVAAVLLVWTRPWQAPVDAPFVASSDDAERAAGPATAPDDEGGGRRVAAGGEGPVAAGAGAATEREDAPTVTVTGRVLDVDGRPLADARLVVTSWLLRSADSPPPRGPVATTDLDGRFAFEVVDAGTRQVTDLRLEARCDGYEVADRAVSPRDGDVEFRLARTGRRLRGQVIDLAGRPAPGIEVTLELWREVERASGRNQTLMLWTDEHGRFDAGWIPAGRGLAFASDVPPAEGGAADRAAFAWVASAPFDLATRPVDDVALRAERPASIDVEVVDAAGRPVDGAKLWAVSAAARYADRVPAMARDETDGEGRGALGPLLPGTVHVTVRVGSDRLDADLELSPGVTAPHRVRMEAAVCTLDVQLVGLDADRLQDVTVRALDPRELRGIEALTANRSGQPDTDGVARLDGLRGDLRYRLVLDSKRGELASRDGVDPSVGVLRWDVGDLDTPPTGGVRGRLWSDAGPLSGAVQLMRHEPTLRMLGTFGVGADGRFEFTDIAPGPCTLTLRAANHVGYGQDIEIVAGRITDVGDLKLVPMAVLAVRIPGITAELAQGTRVTFWGPRHALQALQRDPERPGAFRPIGLDPGPITLAWSVPGCVPAMREVRLTGGDNAVQLPRPEPGVPLKLDLFLRTAVRVRGYAEWTIRDAAGEIVLRDVTAGHMDDPDTGRVTRSIALASGRYRIELVQSIGGGEKLEVAQDFDVVADRGERAVTLRIE